MVAPLKLMGSMRKSVDQMLCLVFFFFCSTWNCETALFWSTCCVRPEEEMAGLTLAWRRPRAVVCSVSR